MPSARSCAPRRRRSMCSPTWSAARASRSCSPVAQQAMARQFFGRNLAAHRDAGFAHDTRWHTTGALKRLLSPAIRTGRDAPAELLADLPSGFAGWTPLAQDQYLECRTLLAGYLLSSQG